MSNGYKVNGLTSSYSKFLDKLSCDWKYNLPSDNLWTVAIHVHDYGGGTSANATMETLYENINVVNRKYINNIGGAWDVKMLGQSLTSTNNATASKILKEYYSGFTEELGMFLCQGVSLPNVNLGYGYTFEGIQSHSGFIRPGQYITNRQHEPIFSINIFETNFSLRDIFFEKWVSAVGQQGLIEDETLPNIKADVYLYNFSAGIPGYDEAKWQLRRAIKFVKCYPVGLNNSEIRMGYEHERAGTAKTFTVTLAFDEMVSDYKVAPNKGTTSETGVTYYTGGTTSSSK